MAFATGQGSVRMSTEPTGTKARTMVRKFIHSIDENLAPPRAAGDDDSDDAIGGDDEGRSGLATKTRTKTKKPSMYKVLMLNDDYTPMEFVVMVVEQFFSKSHEDALQIMLHVHQKGVGICGVFTYEVAETKVTQVMDFARKNEHPLQCTLEKD
jgi:ATP-dependent Clp protease adaptor protein ClpS